MNQRNEIRLLLVEDDTNLGYLVRDVLSGAGYAVTLVSDGAQALPAFTKESFHLCVLDIMLPGKDGFQIAREIRRLNREVPLLFLSAKDAREDRVLGFRLGADDYLTKPFSIEELQLRIEAILRRSGRLSASAAPESEVRFGRCTFDVGNQRLLIGGHEHALTYREAKLLHIFSMHPNQLLSRDLLLQTVWEDEGLITGRSLDVFVSRLRKLLQGDPSVRLVNVHGVGYRLTVDG